jgi:hypothetical protein
MKSAFTFLLLFTCTLAFAQVPQSLSYQAVARDANGECLADQQISLQISILKNTVDGPVLYRERFEGSVQTNAVGHFEVKIGTGSPQTGAEHLNFSDIRWTNLRSFLKVEYAPGNTNAFQEVGTTELLTVPYAMAAGNGKQLSNSNLDEFLIVRGTNGVPNVALGGSGANQQYNDGAIRLVNPDNLTVADLRSFPSDAGSHGRLILRGPAGNSMITLDRNAADCSDHGRITTRDATGTIKAEIRTYCSGDGWIIADGANGGIKSFRMPHPTKPDKQIVYACIEGPEAGAYERGTVTLVNGEAEVTFSETFGIVANPETLTIMTSAWSAESKGLAVIERTERGFKIKEFGGGTGNYKVDWEAKAVRKGWEDFEVVQDLEKEELGSSEAEELSSNQVKTHK